MRAAVRSGDLYNPLLGNTLATYVKMGTGFTLRVDGTFGPTLVGASGGYSELDLWQVPDSSNPILITHAYIVITGDGTASSNPASPDLRLTLGGFGLVAAAMSAWGGTSYSVAAGSTNKKYFGGKKTERDENIIASLLDDSTTLANNGNAIRGGQAGSPALLIDGGGTNKLADSVLRLRVTNNAGSGITFTLPFRAYLFGFLG